MLPIEKIETPKNEKGERIYYDMTLVVPTDALPAKLGIKNKKKRKKAEKFDQLDPFPAPSPRRPHVAQVW